MIDPLELIVLLAIAAPAATPAVDRPPGVEASSRPIDALVIDASIGDLVALEAAIRLRLADTPVTRSDRARQPRAGELFAYLEVEPQAGERSTLRLTLGDARAWVRTIESPASDRTREIATTVGNLLAGIELDSIAPDLLDVPLPMPLQRSTAAVVRPPVASKPRPAPPRLAWGLGGDAVVVLGLGPPPPAGVAAGGFALRSAVRWRRGALVVAGLRAGMRHRDDFTITRLRLDVGGGYAWHRGAFALHTTAAITAEPWFVTSSGAVPDGGRRPVSALVGAAVRIAPGWRVAVGRRHLGLMPFVELAGSAVPGRGGGVARVRTGTADDPVDVFRAGGLELAAGLSVVVWTPASN